jgi:hypothetical protein
MKKIFTLVLLSIAFDFSSAQNCINNSNSITFDGFSSYASPANQTNLNITDSLTIEAWINPNSFAFNSANNSIVCKHGWSSGEGGFVLRCGGAGEVSFNIAGLDVNQNPTSWKEVLSPTNALTLGTWTHVAGSYDGQNLKLYINGVEQNVIAFAGSIVASPNYPLTLGKLSDPGQFSQRYFDGKIDEVRIWHRALPAAEILANMNKHIDPVAAVDLVSYWRFNEGSGSNSTDLQSGNDITLNGNGWDISVPFNQVPPMPTITFNGTELIASNSDGNWYLNGTLIPNATDSNYTPLVNGDYTFTTNPTFDGCTSTSAVLTISTVATNNLINNLEINIYPNPIAANDLLNIQSSTNYNNISFSLSDIAGRKVFEAQGLSLKSGFNQIQINASNLNHGIYFYEFMSNKNNIAKGKLIIK